MAGMEPKWKITRQRDFTGGENRVASFDLLAANQIYLGMNCVLAADGSLETRKGKTQINTTSLGAGKVIAAFRWAKENGTKYLTVQHGTTLYNAVWDGVSTVSSFTSVKTGLAADVKLRGVVWKDNLILVNGVQNNFRFDGTTSTDLAGTPPKSTLISVYASRIWINDVASPNLIRFSDLESYDVFDTLNVVKFRSGDGEVITGLASQSGGMVVFKSSSMWTLYGSSIDNIRVDILNDNFGTISPDSILADGFFVGPDNLYRFSLSSVSPFAPTHRTYITPLNTLQKQAIAAVYLPLDQRIIVTLRDYRQLCIDVQTNAVFTWAGLNVCSLSAATTTGDDGSLILGDANNGLLYIINNIEDDAGAGIPTDVQLAYTDMNICTDKVFRAIRPTLEVVHPRTGHASVASIIYDIDHTNSGFAQTTPLYNAVMKWDDELWNSKEWGGPHGAENIFVFHFSERGRFISLRTTSQARIKVKGFELKFRYIGRDL